MGLLKKNGESLSSIILLSFVLVACIPTHSLRHFTFYGETKKVDPNKLKINGIYYSIVPRKCNAFEVSDHVKWFIFYENGFFLSLDYSGLKQDSLEISIEQYLASFSKRRGYRYQDNEINWGAYVINRNTLFMQGYYRIAAVRCYVFQREAKIIDNTTISFVKGFCENNSEIAKKFTLLETSSKPDSVNIFMANKRIKRKLDRLYEKRHSK